jgi:hypothetical protein
METHNGSFLGGRMSEAASGVMLASALLLAMPCTAHGLECDADNLAGVNGWVETTNVSETLQVGQVYLVVSGTDGVVFEDTGAIVGQITAATPPTVFLNHTMIFNRGQRVETRGDVAILGEPLAYEGETPCAFPVTEHITDLSGNKIFRNAEADVTAHGTISFCSFNNANSFTLSGEVCLK